MRDSVRAQKTFSGKPETQVLQQVFAQAHATKDRDTGPSPAFAAYLGHGRKVTLECHGCTDVPPADAFGVNNLDVVSDIRADAKEITNKILNTPTSERFLNTAVEAIAAEETD